MRYYRVFFCFVYFRVSLLVHGSAYQLVFTKSLHSLAGQSCDREIGEVLLVCIYIPAPFTESLDRLGRKMICFKSPGMGLWESNASYTARVNPIPSALSTRPTHLPYAMSTKESVLVLPQKRCKCVLCVSFWDKFISVPEKSPLKRVITTIKMVFRSFTSPSSARDRHNTRKHYVG